MNRPERPDAAGQDAAREVSEGDVYDRAVGLLARREHSVWELRYKLNQRNFPTPLIDGVIGRLVEAGFLSDERFAEVFARSRVDRGWGPLRIRAALGERRVDEQWVSRALELLEVDWFALAAEVYRRKYRDAPVKNYRERAKRQTFLARRGFEARHCRAVVDSASNAESSE